MGGKSGSKSTSSQTTHQTDRRVGAAEGAVVATEGASVTTNIDIESVDPEIAQAALAEAFGFGVEALASSAAVTGQAFSFATEAQEAVEDLAAKGSEQAEALQKLLTTTALVAVAGFYLLGRK